MRLTILLFFAALLGAPSLALGAGLPLQPWQSLPQSQRSQIANSGIFLQGIADNYWYAPLIDPTTGGIPVAIVSGGGSSGAVGAIGATLPANAIVVGADSTTGTLEPLNLDINGNLKTASSQSSKATGALFINNYSTTNVTTSAYVQMVASTSTALTQVYVFDSSGSGMILATGALGSEVPALYIPPGGSSAGWPLAIPAGTRLSLKVLPGFSSATSGFFILTGLD